MMTSFIRSIHTFLLLFLFYERRYILFLNEIRPFCAAIIILSLVFSKAPSSFHPPSLSFSRFFAHLTNSLLFAISCVDV